MLHRVLQGKPTVVGYTRNDIATWSEVMARTLTSAGANRNDFIQVAYGYGLLPEDWDLHYGGEKIGASVIPISGGNTSTTNSAYARFWKHCSGLHSFICIISC
jgi:phenylacetate-coenzyme A ligase PaaK-like adenylate-forming protein